MWTTSSLDAAITPTAVALGNFDGIHLGHRQVIQPVFSSPVAEVVGTAPRGSLIPCATVVTFQPHPQVFFTGQSRPLLTPLPEKVAHLRQLGVEQLVLLPFDQALASLTPDEFVEMILVRQLQAQRISVGQDFCFGRQRSGTAQVLQAIAARYGIEVTITPLELLAGERISSSAIRQALTQGNLALANRLLGRTYSLSGKVAAGQQLGRTLGFPTANLVLPPEKFLPQQGVYAVRACCCNPDDLLPIGPELPGVMNLGLRPTVQGTRLTAEVHLLEWSGDLYGQTLQVKLESFLRPEQSFASLEALKAQIAADCEAAKTQLAATRDAATL